MSFEFLVLLFLSTIRAISGNLGNETPSKNGVEKSRSDEEQIEEENIRAKLKKHLLRGYDRFRVPTRPPSVSASTAVNVSLYMWPYDIVYVNEAKSSMKISGWLDYRWADTRLAWTPSDWGGITHMFLPALAIWYPLVDIVYSKEEGVGFTNCLECYLRIDFHGEILRGQYFSYSFPCKINVKYFPFDRQSCGLEVANWFLDDQQMDLYPHAENVDMSVFLTNEEWDLLNITVMRKNNFYTYGYFPSLTYTIHVKRKPFYYICNLIAPSVIITTTAVIGYHMPSTSAGVHQEKVKMGLTAILSIFILQLGIVDKLPRTSDVIPLLNIFYFCLVWILSSAIVATSMVIVVEKKGLSGKSVPTWARRMFMEPWTMGCLFGRKHKACQRRKQSTTQERYMRTMPCTCPVSPTNNLQGIGKGNQPQLPPSAMPRAMSSGSMFAATSNCIHNSNCKVAMAPPVNHAAIPDELLTCLRAVRASVEQVCEQMREHKSKQAVRIEWALLADSVETVSLYSFLCGIAFSLGMFIFHGWY